MNDGSLVYHILLVVASLKIFFFLDFDILQQELKDEISFKLIDYELWSISFHVSEAILLTGGT